MALSQTQLAPRRWSLDIRWASRLAQLAIIKTSGITLGALNPEPYSGLSEASRPQDSAFGFWGFGVTGFGLRGQGYGWMEEFLVQSRLL